VLRPCAADKISNADGTACVSCGHGFHPNHDQSACINPVRILTPQTCPKGQVLVKSGDKAVCLICRGNTVASADGSTCLQCPKGYACQQGPDGVCQTDFLGTN
jgi:hypothetical protein